jgi:hypothetical protein
MNTDPTENNPATDPNNEIEGAYASNPALRPDANTTNTAQGGSTADTNSDSTGNTAQTANTNTDEVVSVERENPATDPVNEVGGAYASNPVLQSGENERRDGETEEQRLNRLREERQRDVPELDSDRGNF